MNNNDERDYSEESYNKGLLRNPDDLDEDETFWRKVDQDVTNSDNWGVMSESAQEVEDRLDEYESPDTTTEQTQLFVLGHSGHVNVSWHIINNLHEMYDMSIHGGKSYILPAFDGSTLYVWASLHLTDDAAHAWAGSATGQFLMKYSQFNTIWI